MILRRKKKSRKKKTATVQRLKPNWNCSNGSKKKKYIYIKDKGT